jgi:ATP-binding cassette subfamily F protein uup
MSYMKDFLFLPEQAGSPISRLSGGERGRLQLARALAQPSNLLVLDEPTNDLDLETLDLLQEMIGDYPGTVILVSHDRDFLDRTVTSVVVAEGEGRWVEYAGGYSDMLAQRGRGVEAKAAAKTERTREASPERTGKPSAKRKLSFNDQHALKTIPKRIEALHAEITRLQALLADPALYTRDSTGFAQLSARLEAAQTGLSAAEDEWLRLEMLREAIEQPA